MRQRRAIPNIDPGGPGGASRLLVATHGGPDSHPQNSKHNGLVVQSFFHHQSQAIASGIAFTKLVAKLNISWLYVTGASAEGFSMDSIGQSLAAQEYLEAATSLARKTVRPGVPHPDALVDFTQSLSQRDGAPRGDE